jgi:hypothetical protein
MSAPATRRAWTGGNRTLVVLRSCVLLLWYAAEQTHAFSLQGRRAVTQCNTILVGRRGGGRNPYALEEPHWVLESSIGPNGDADDTNDNDNPLSSLDNVTSVTSATTAGSSGGAVLHNLELYRNRSFVLERALQQKLQALHLSRQKLLVLQDAAHRVVQKHVAKAAAAEQVLTAPPVLQPPPTPVVDYTMELQQLQEQCQQLQLQNEQWKDQCQDLTQEKALVETKLDALQTQYDRAQTLLAAEQEQWRARDQEYSEMVLEWQSALQTSRETAAQQREALLRELQNVHALLEQEQRRHQLAQDQLQVWSETNESLQQLVQELQTELESMAIDLAQTSEVEPNGAKGSPQDDENVALPSDDDSTKANNDNGSSSSSSSRDDEDPVAVVPEEEDAMVIAQAAVAASLAREERLQHELDALRLSYDATLQQLAESKVTTLSEVPQPPASSRMTAMGLPSTTDTATTTLEEESAVPDVGAMPLDKSIESLPPEQSSDEAHQPVASDTFSRATAITTTTTTNGAPTAPRGTSLPKEQDTAAKVSPIRPSSRAITLVKGKVGSALRFARTTTRDFGMPATRRALAPLVSSVRDSRGWVAMQRRVVQPAQRNILATWQRQMEWLGRFRRHLWMWIRQLWQSYLGQWMQHIPIRIVWRSSTTAATNTLMSDSSSND